MTLLNTFFTDCNRPARPPAWHHYIHHSSNYWSSSSYQYGTAMPPVYNHLSSAASSFCFFAAHVLTDSAMISACHKCMQELYRWPCVCPTPFFGAYNIKKNCPKICSKIVFYYQFCFSVIYTALDGVREPVRSLVFYVHFDTILYPHINKSWRMGPHMQCHRAEYFKHCFCC